MKLGPSVKALLAVLVVAGLMGLGWLRYKKFLTQGRQPPKSSRILSRLEKDGLPDFTLTDIDGKTVELSKFKGKVVILNFWASWCDPCVGEFPSLVKLVRRFNGQVQMIAVSADYNLNDIRNFLKTFKVTSKDTSLHVIWDKDQKLAKEYGTFRLPESYIIGRDGKLVRKIAGIENWATDDAYTFFADLTKNKVDKINR